MTTRVLAAAMSIAALTLAGCSADTTETAESTSGAESNHLEQAQEIQGQLDPFFEGCDWAVNVDERDSAQTSCSEHEIGIVVATGSNSVQSILDSIGESTPIGGYVMEDNSAVWSTNDGNVNMAWDVLGATGERGSFGS